MSGVDGVPEEWDLIVPALDAIANGETSVWGVSVQVAQDLALPNEAKWAITPDGGNYVLARRIGSACETLRFAGVIAKRRRGSLAITDLGRSLLDMPVGEAQERILHLAVEPRRRRAKRDRAAVVALIVVAVAAFVAAGIGTSRVDHEPERPDRGSEFYEREWGR